MGARQRSGRAEHHFITLRASDVFILARWSRWTVSDVGPSCCSRSGKDVIDVMHVMLYQRMWVHFDTPHAMPAHKIGTLTVLRPLLPSTNGYLQGLCSFVPTAVPFSTYHAVTNRQSLANSVTTKNPPLVCLSSHLHSSFVTIFHLSI